MLKVVQQLIRNANLLTDAYLRTKDASLLEIIKSLLSAAEEELAAQPQTVLSPSIFPALPELPTRQPDRLFPSITAYAVPDVNGPWLGTGTTSTTLTVETASTVSDKILVVYENSLNDT